MNTPSSQKTKKILIISLLASLLLISLFSLFLYYIGSLNKEVAELKVKVAQFKSTEEEKNLSERTLKETAENRTRIDAFFVGADQEEEVKFVSLLEELATSTAKVELVINSLRHESLVGIKSDRVEFLAVQASAKGTFSEIYHYLTLLESFPKGIVVKQAEMEAIDGDPKKAKQWKLSFVAQALKVK